MRIEIADLGGERISIASSEQIEEVAAGRLPTGEEQEGIRWYIEDFEASPFGGDTTRAVGVEKQFVELGRDLFQPILEIPWIRQILDRDLKEGTSQLEFVIRSDNSDFLSLPWELAYSDTGGCFLASAGVAFSREHLGVPRVDAKPRQRGPIRVLLIIARPKRLGEVPVGTIANSLMQIASDYSSQVEVDVLRPPTIESLQKRLADREYDIVHFDGHGEFVGVADFEADRGSQGYLLFETADAYPDPVSARDLTGVMPRGSLPVFVLNACKSARAGREQPMSSISAQLLQCGSPGVVAMSYSVRADAVQIFMRAFYRSLISDSRLAHAVALGRRELLQNRAHKKHLQDWFIPVLFSYQEPSWLDFSSVEPSLRAVHTTARDWARLFGRGAELIEVERRFASGSEVVIVHGAIGSGKTEFSRGFAEWFEASGGVNNAIIVDVYTCGSVREAVQQTLRTVAGRSAIANDNPNDDLPGLIPGTGLVVWDHAETMLSDLAEWAVLQQLQLKLAAADWKLLLTTCGPVAAESAFPPLELHDLTNEEASRRLIEACNPQTLAGMRSIVRGLLQAAEYYPRELDRLISAIATDGISQAIEVMQWGIPSEGIFPFDARVGEAFDRLGDRAQRILPLLGLFGGRVNPGYLTIFTNGGLKHDIYAEWFDSSVTADEWFTLLTEAASVGLVSGPHKAGIFLISPMVRMYFRQVLRDSHGESGLESLTVGVVELYSALAQFWNREDQEFNKVIVTIEEGSLLRSVYAAVRRKMFSEARVMVGTLTVAWQRNGFLDSVPWFLSDIRDFTGPDFPRDEKELLLWAELASCEAHFTQSKGDNQLLAKLDREIIQRLGACDGMKFLKYVAESEIRLADAACRHGDATVARRHLDRAEKLATRLNSESIKVRCARIRAELALQRAGSPEGVEVPDVAGAVGEPSPDVALHHERLGSAAMAREDYGSAHDHFAAAYRVWLLIGRQRESINARSLLADSLDKMGHTGEALRIYKEVIHDQQRTGQHGRAANTALLIGQVLEQLGRFREAKEWCESAIPVMRRLGMKMALGHVQHELAIISMTTPEKADSAQAIQYLQEAISNYEELDSPRHAASSLLMLAQVYLQENSLENARKALRRSRDLSDRIGSRESEAHRELLLAQTELMLESPEKAIEALAAFSRLPFVTMKSPESDRFFQLLMTARNRLGKARFQVAWDAAGGSQQLIEEMEYSDS